MPVALGKEIFIRHPGDEVPDDFSRLMAREIVLRHAADKPPDRGTLAVMTLRNESRRSRVGARMSSSA